MLRPQFLGLIAASLAFTQVAQAELKTSKGVIASVDVAEGSLTVVLDSKEKLELEISRKAKINVGEDLGDPTDLEADQEVTVTYEPTIQIATKIEIVPPPTVQKAGVELFNGTDLSGWAFETNRDRNLNLSNCWKVDAIEKTLTCLANPTTNWIETEGKYKDFTLETEWRFIPGGKLTAAGSGITVRVDGRGKWRGFPKGIQIDIAKGHCGDFDVNQTTLETEDGVATEARAKVLKKQKSGEKPAGEWNKYEIICKGSNVTVFLNGVLVNKGRRAQPIAGGIALISKSSDVQFRNIRLIEQQPAPKNEAKPATGAE